jgi:hypothetical protein
MPEAFSLTKITYYDMYKKNVTVLPEILAREYAKAMYGQEIDNWFNEIEDLDLTFDLSDIDETMDLGFEYKVNEPDDKEKIFNVINNCTMGTNELIEYLYEIIDNLKMINNKK